MVRLEDTVESLPVIVFTASAAALLYVLAGYPLVLALLTRRYQKPLERRFEEKTVSVVMAVRDGEPWIVQKLRSILTLNYPRDRMEIIVVSDGSEDHTDELVAGFAAQGVRLIRVPAGGKAAALNAGIAAASNEILFFTDVRQPLDTDCLRHLVACFADPRVGVASGELEIRRGASHAEQNIGLYWRYEKWIRKHLSSLDSVMGATGCIYAMRRQLAVPLPANLLVDDVYLPLAAFFQGFRVVFEPRAKAFDDPSSLRVEFRRKVRTLSGVYQVLWYYPRLLIPFSNRMWFHFVSHKLGRQVLPFAVLTLAASSLALPDPWRTLAVIGGLLFCFLAAVDPLLPQTSSVHRLSSVARTFLVLVAASFCALGIFFFPHRLFWKPTRIGASKPSA
jgi:cellulose synthase/poly-beta-1,6-N-acetylglucosamine synthase-like glycosyltransferase